MNERKVLFALVISIGGVIGMALAGPMTFWDAVIIGFVTFCFIIAVMALWSMKSTKK